MQLTLRDRQILHALVHRVRVFSMHQIHTTWWGDSPSAPSTARARVNRLAGAGWLEAFPGMARPFLPLEAPVLRWMPGQVEPDMARASYSLKDRWREPPIPVSLVCSTVKTGNWLGGSGGRRPRPSEQTHDLHVSALFLQLKAADPECSETWKSEAQLAIEGFGFHQKLPDAMITRGGRCWVLEFGGAYSQDKLREFHAFCEERELAYEVW